MLLNIFFYLMNMVCVASTRAVKGWSGSMQKASTYRPIASVYLRRPVREGMGGVE